MKKSASIFLISLFTLQNSFSFDQCLAPVGENFETINKLIENVSEAKDQLPQYDKVLDITVTKVGQLKGNGMVKVLQNEKGDITAIQVEFKQNDKKKETMIRTFDELNSGKTLEYKDAHSSQAALIVKKQNGVTLSRSSGGPFTFSILTNKDPAKYTHYTLFLRKNGNDWVAKNQNGTILEVVDLTPEVVGLTDWNWEGTFSKASFK